MRMKVYTIIGLILIFVLKAMTLIILCVITDEVVIENKNLKGHNLSCSSSKKGISSKGKDEQFTTEECNNLEEDYPYVIRNGRHLCKEDVSNQDVVHSTNFDDPQMVKEEFASHSKFWFTLSTYSPILTTVFAFLCIALQIGIFCFKRGFYSRPMDHARSFLLWATQIYLEIYWIVASSAVYIVLSVDFDDKCINYQYDESDLEKAFNWKNFCYFMIAMGCLYVFALLAACCFGLQGKLVRNLVLGYVAITLLIMFGGLIYLWIVCSKAPTLANKLLILYTILMPLLEISQFILEKHNRRLEIAHRENVRKTRHPNYYKKGTKVELKNLHCRDAPPLPSYIGIDDESEDRKSLPNEDIHLDVLEGQVINSEDRENNTPVEEIKSEGSNKNEESMEDNLNPYPPLPSVVPGESPILNPKSSPDTGSNQSAAEEGHIDHMI